jgi:hypothetical protein
MIKNPPNKKSLTEEKMILLLSGFQPKPGHAFLRRMEAAPWNQKQVSRTVCHAQLKVVLRLVTFAFLVILLLWLPFFISPSLLSNARQMFRYFLVSDENSRSIEVTHIPTSASTFLLPEPSFPLSIEEAATTAGFPLKTLTALPTGVAFEGVAYDTTRQAVIIKYAGDGKTILFTQREKDRLREYSSVGPEATAEFVTVRGVQGEFIPGGWVVKTQAIPQPGLETQRIELIWENQAGMATLRWEEDGFIYEIIVTSPQNFPQKEILAIAESMR